MRSPLARALAALARVLEKQGVRWYLFGAQAALLYGAARLTADVDVTVDLGHWSLPDLVAALGGEFDLRVADAVRFAEETRVVPFVHRSSRMPLDIILAGPGLEELFFKRRRRRMVDGVRVHVASPEDVIVMKVLAGRGKDEDDAVAILAAQRRLNLALIRSTLVSLEAALDQSDLSPRFEQLLARARSAF